MSNLIQNFIQESLDLLFIAENNLLVLERDYINFSMEELPKEKKELVHSLFRAIHTIKGNSGLFDLEKVKNLTHVFENILTKIRNNEIRITREFIDVSLLAIDRIRSMIENLTNEKETYIDDIIEQLEKIQSQALKTNQEIKRNTEVSFESIYLNHYERIYNILLDLQRKFKENEFYFCIINLPEDELLSNYHKVIETFENKYKILFHDFIEFQNHIYPFWIVNKPENIPYKILYQKQTIIQDSRSDEKRNKEVEKPYYETTFMETEAFLKVPANLIEELINLAGESIIARNELLQRLSTSYKEHRELWSSGKKVSLLISQIQEKLMKLRLQELNVLFERIPRIARELSKETQKEIDLEIDGGKIELDKTLIDAIRDPIVHIIRNAVDHGIETQEERIRKGKPPKGKITIKAFFRGGNVIITVQDDGRGIDPQKIVKKAIEKNIITPSDAEKFTKKEIIDLIFLPGFSTADKITERSGRGVGMDVVKNSLRSIKGFVDIETEIDQGTTIILTIPQTLSIITCLVIQIYDRKYAIPQNQIREIIKIDHKYLTNLHGSLVYELRNYIIPVIDPYFIVRSNYENKHIEHKSNFEYLIFLETDQHIYGLLTSDILSPEELMIKPLGEEFNEIPFYSGGTILGDGDTILVLDVLGIAKSFHIQSNRKEIELSLQEQARKQTQTKKYLIFESEGYYYGISIENKPRVVEVPIKEIETLLNFHAFKYQNHLTPLLDVNKILNVETKMMMFDRKSIYAIILRNQNEEYISLQATTILNITDEFDSITKEIEKETIIDSYAIHNGQTLILLDVDRIFLHWKNSKLQLNKANHKMNS
ncbi:MAG: chemotaxis protein CheA [Leptospiraceae bacterium]|nr:chemotaxis protein CheA [Leptospiraceae bacterium]MDW7975799.1 chemotaxis protein CheA [Leptospiraceae bacterium]